jgi:Xaa-Pro aminopeptidase
VSRDAIHDPKLHRARRTRLLEALGDGLLLLPTAPETLRNGDVHHEYRPGSDFHYLTGFPEPEAVLAAWRTGRGRHRAVLFVRPRDPAREVWDGKRYGPALAQRWFGVDAAHPIADLWRVLAEVLPTQPRLFHRLGADPAWDQRLLQFCAAQAKKHRRREPPAHPVIQDPLPVLAAQRLQKDQGEIDALRVAAAITASGHEVAMRAARPGRHEYEVQAALEAEFRRLGSPRNGYASIVASGPNACILHYHENDRRLRDGDLLLIDAGAEFAGHTGDVTRTFPVGRAFTEAQAAVYRVVLRAQLAGIRACRLGARSDAPHRTCVRVLTQGLVALGVLRGTVAKLVASERYKPWYMHGTSHWLGRDVHDVGAYRDSDDRPEPLPQHAVLTVEPGLYFAPDDRKVPRELRGIGIRIEDDVLVTARGPEVLTAAAPKSIAAIERICAGRDGTD